MPVSAAGPEESEDIDVATGTLSATSPVDEGKGGEMEGLFSSSPSLMESLIWGALARLFFLADWMELVLLLLGNGRAS